MPICIWYLLNRKQISVFSKINKPQTEFSIYSINYSDLVFYINEVEGLH